MAPVCRIRPDAQEGAGPLACLSGTGATPDPRRPSAAWASSSQRGGRWSIGTGTTAADHDPKDVETALLERVHHINDTVDKHARIGAVVISKEPWTIENEVLTPTMKIRREQVEGRFGELAQQLAHDAAVEGEVFVRWVD